MEGRVMSTSTTQFLEQLACKVHHHPDIVKLISTQPDRIQKAIIMNDPESLKKEISDIVYYANESHVVQINLCFLKK